MVIRGGVERGLDLPPLSLGTWTSAGAASTVTVVFDDGDILSLVGLNGFFGKNLD